MRSDCQISASQWKPLTEAHFRDVIGRFASGVTILTTELDGEHFGTTANAITSVSVDPPMLLACLNQSSETRRAIGASGRFAVNILGIDQAALARRFAAKGASKFEGVERRLGPGSLPLVADALAVLCCTVVEATRGGTHSIFMAEVTHAEAREGEPLAYFRGAFGRVSALRIDHGGSPPRPQ